MRSATFLAASSLLAAIHAAPRAMPFGSVRFLQSVSY